jgi:retinol dehydrogenase 12
MAKYSIFAFLRSQFLPVPPLVQADIRSQTVIVTGANIGLGLAAAKQIATMNPQRLILACRNRSKGEQAVIGEPRLPNS